MAAYVKGHNKDFLPAFWNHLTKRQQAEVEDFARFLADQPVKHRNDNSVRYISGEGWSGGLAHLKDRYPSGVSLQHEALVDWEKSD